MIPIAGIIGPLGAGEWSIGGLGAVGTGPAAAVGTAPATGNGSFSSALSSAVNSLEQSQSAADSASQGLATGTLTDPTQAVTAVENASLELDFASQIRDKLTSDVSTIFQTQM